MSDAPKDVQMIHAGLCTVVDEFGALPIFGHTVDGNQNGHTAVAATMRRLRVQAVTCIYCQCIGVTGDGPSIDQDEGLPARR